MEAIDTRYRHRNPLEHPLLSPTPFPAPETRMDDSEEPSERALLKPPKPMRPSRHVPLDPPFLSPLFRYAPPFPPHALPYSSYGSIPPG